MDPKFVSVIIPCRDEEKFIGSCLDSVIAQDYPKEYLEVLVADGMSTDQTREVLKNYAGKYSFIRWFENPKKLASCALNIMIQQAKGEIIVRLDAHNEYPRDYVLKCVSYLEKYKADNVGGLWHTVPGADTLTAKAIALALICKFGIGNADYRLGVKEPTWVDTVPFGCYRREIFSKIGLFDEGVLRNEDDEFNARLINNGGKILLVPEIVSTYHARESYSKLWRVYFQYGYLKPLVVVKVGRVMTWRQLIPALFIGSMVLLAAASFVHPVFQWLLFMVGGAYLLSNVCFSLGMAFRQNIRLFPYLVWAFWIIHCGYGVGYLKGLWQFVILKERLNNKIQDMAISR